MQCNCVVLYRQYNQSHTTLVLVLLIWLLCSNRCCVGLYLLSSFACKLLSLWDKVLLRVGRDYKVDVSCCLNRLTVVLCYIVHRILSETSDQVSCFVLSKVATIGRSWRQGKWRFFRFQRQDLGNQGTTLFGSVCYIIRSYCYACLLCIICVLENR